MWMFDMEMHNSTHTRYFNYIRTDFFLQKIKSNNIALRTVDSHLLENIEIVKKFVH